MRVQGERDPAAQRKSPFLAPRAALLGRARRLFGWAGGSVRAKLLVLVLAPLLLGVPVLLGLAWTWGNEAYERLVAFKVGSDLATAHQYFAQVVHGVGEAVQALAGSGRLMQRLPPAPAAASASARAALDELLPALAQENGLDFLHFLAPDGRPLAAARALAPDAPRAGWPAVAAALAGTPHTTVERLTPEQLEHLDPALRRRAYLPLVPTRAAAPDPRTAEERGLIIHAAAPVYDAARRLVGVLEGGVLLNGNLAIVDHLNAIVYREGSLPLGSRGTATLFLDDTRIATNVSLFEGTRALGTLVSQVVRERVLERGETWLGTAFVVNDHYVSGYEPILDGRGERVGMLYVGFLEAPLRSAMRWGLFALFAVFIAVSAVGTLLSLRWARSVFQPVERINAVIQRVAAGETGARVGPLTSRDELGRLAGEFDRLLDTLAAKRERLERWADELDRKVAERTAALSEATATLSRAQQQLVMSEKLAAIGELTAGVAHELNNPVAVIQGNLEVLHEVLGAGAAPVREEIRLIHEQAERIRQIVARLLQFARPGEFAGYAGTLDANAVVGDCLLLARHNLERSGVTVTTRLAATCGIEINRGELQQVLINLIVNAAQAMPEGGRLSVTSEDWPAGTAPEAPAAGGAAPAPSPGTEPACGVVLRVRDTGHGIAPEHLARIFDPFFTTKKGSGTGLGLSISHAIVARYGGHITVASHPGMGTEFGLWLRRQARYDAAAGQPGFLGRPLSPA